MFIGGVLADVPVLAVAAIAGLGIGSALLAARVRFGQVAMTLSLPMVGVGLSYPDLGKAAGLAGLMVLGSVFGCVVSMFWPERTLTQARAAVPNPTLGYGGLRPRCNGCEAWAGSSQSRSARSQRSVWYG